MGENAFYEAFHEADYVIHAATATILTSDDPYKDIIDPSVQGTLNVLKAAAQTKTLKRVMYTSSITASIFSDRFIKRPEDDVVDESWWSDTDYLMKFGWHSHASKTLAEQAAFEFVKDAPFDFVSIVPVTVMGDILSNSGSFSSNDILRIFNGIDREEDDDAIPMVNSFVDVEDVALAHILAMENPSAEGRYLTIECSQTSNQLTVLLAKLFPQYTSVLKPDMKGMDGATFMKPVFKFSNEKLKTLGLTLSPLSESGKKCVAGLQRMNQL